MSPLRPLPRRRGVAPALAALLLAVGTSGAASAQDHDGDPARDVVLRAPAARLTVRAVDGARVVVDGTPVGVTPFPRALELEPGPHRIEVLANGFEPATRAVQLRSGVATDLGVDLTPTGQRQLAWAFIGTGAAGVAVGIALGVVAVVEQRKAQDLGQDGEAGREEDQADYDAAVAARDGFRLGSGLGAGVGLGLFLTGGLLFAFDAPEQVSPRTGKTLRLLPSVGPTSGGGVATFTF